MLTQGVKHAEKSISQRGLVWDCRQTGASHDICLPIIGKHRSRGGLVRDLRFSRFKICHSVYHQEPSSERINP